MKISSLHNPKIRYLLSLSKSARRKADNVFVIEGLREISRAYTNKFEMDSVFLCPEILTKDASDWLMNIKNTIEVYEITREIYKKIAYRENVDGIIVLARARKLVLDEIDPGINPLILIMESVEKPGNLGAVLRSADAAGVNVVIICDPKTDIYNPNVIRSSLGCIFSKQVVVCDSNSAIRYLNNKNIKIFSAALQDAIPYTKADLTGPSAIVLGSEARGLSQIWREKAEKVIKIPMYGIADSLNVSVSAGILIFEALRQRKSHYQE